MSAVNKSTVLKTFNWTKKYIQLAHLLTMGVLLRLGKIGTK